MIQVIQASAMFDTGITRRLNLTFLLLATLLSGCVSIAEVIELPPSRMLETSDLADVRDLALEMADVVGTDQVLVVLDLDNTLLAMEQNLGSDQWYDWQKKLLESEPCDPRVLPDRLAVQGAVYFASAMRLTQPDGAGVIRNLQDDGFTVIVVTSRGPDFRLQTFRELRRNGFNFYASAFGPEGGYDEDFQLAGDGRPVRYEDGVFLTAGQNKGVMLQALLLKTATPWPAIIIMADDKVKNLQDMLDAFHDNGTSVQAFRYRAEDARVAAFDGEEAAQQWTRAEPALLELQHQFGPDNYALPEPGQAPGCTSNP